MKPFNLELAKKGYPVCTRDGRKARIVDFYKKDWIAEYPIIALVGQHLDKRYIYDIDGCIQHGCVSPEDLKMVEASEIDKYSVGKEAANFQNEGFIAGCKFKYNELTRWNDPTDTNGLEDEETVLLKVHCPAIFSNYLLGSRLGNVWLTAEGEELPEEIKILGWRKIYE